MKRASIRRRLIVFWAVVLLPGSAGALVLEDVTLEPQHPSVLDIVEVRLHLRAGEIIVPEFEIDDHRVAMTLFVNDAIPVPTPPERDEVHEIGRLEAGAWALDVVALFVEGDGTPVPIGSIPFTVRESDVVPLHGGAFEVRVTWADYSGGTGSGRMVPGRSSPDSALFYFFDPENWELLVKVLDGCGFNGHFWVFAAAASDVQYTIEVTEVATGRGWDHTNPLGARLPPVTDTSAFACVYEVP